MAQYLEKLKFRYLLLAIIPILVILTFFSTMALHKMAKQTSYMSAVSWLDTAIVELLNEYYNKNSIYPNSLNELTIPFPGDNANPDMLKLFAYTTDGNSFRLVLETNPEKKYRYEYIGLRGKMVRFNEYVGDRLVKSTDWKDLATHEIKFE